MKNRDRTKTRNMSKSDINSILQKLRDAKSCATMTNAHFNNITCPDMEIVVKEKDVTQLIRERCKLHHHTWIIEPLEEVIKLLEAKLMDEFLDIPQWNLHPKQRELLANVTLREKLTDTKARQRQAWINGTWDLPETEPKVNHRPAGWWRCKGCNNINDPHRSRCPICQGIK